MTTTTKTSKKLENLLVDCGIPDHPILGEVESLETSVGMMGKVIEEWRIQTDSLTPYEARRKSESLESRLAKAQAFLEDLKRRPYVPPWLIKGLDEAMTPSELKARLDDVKAKQKEYFQRPDVKAKKKEAEP